jgi:hypothetical protein
MTNHAERGTRLQLRSGPLITGAALVAAGGLLALAGLAISSSHVLTASRRWVREMEVPPSEVARLKWAQAKAAAAAGAGAWRNGPSAEHESVS